MDWKGFPMTTYLDLEDVIAPLDTFATLPGWLAAGMDPQAVRRELERNVPEFADRSLELVSVTPERLRAKGHEWIARYRLSISDGASDAHRDVALIGNLLPPFMGGRPTPAESPDLPFGKPGWRCWLPRLRLDLQFEAVDEALPALADIVDPLAAADLLQRVLHDAGYGDVAIATSQPKVVRYKPGSRCTVVADLVYQTEPGLRRPPERVVLKTHQGDKGQTAWSAMTALWHTPLARGDIVSLAEPLAFLPDKRVLVQGPIAEDCTLKELARSALDGGTTSALHGLRAELAKTGRALAALHQSGAVYGRTATIEDELAEVTEVVARLSLSVPELQAAARPLLDRLRSLAGTIPAGPSVPAHHDFRPAQVLLHQGSIGFIDFDGASMAEPALDLGRFRAKLRDIGISVVASREGPVTETALAESYDVMDDLCDHFLNTYREHAPVSPDRVRLWETSDLVTAMLHAWTKVRLARIGPRLAVLQHYLAQVEFAVRA
jgi:hypothetical protein